MDIHSDFVPSIIVVQGDGGRKRFGVFNGIKIIPPDEFDAGRIVVIM